MGKFTRRGAAFGAAVLTASMAFSGSAAFAATSDSSGPIEIDGDPEHVDPLEGPAIWRFADEDRVGTALQAAARTNLPWGESVGEYVGQTAIIATTGDFADALAAAPLADLLDAPVLLDNPGGNVDGRVADYLTTGNYKGYGHGEDFENVVLLGGTDVFAESYVQQLEAAGINVFRYAGANRYQTAAKLAEHTIFIGSLMGSYQNPNIFFADGTDFADALAAGPAAAAHDGVVLLTKGSEGLDSFTFAAVAGDYKAFSAPNLHNHAAIHTIGGPAAAGAANGWLGTGIESDSDTFGDDRYETAVLAAGKFIPGATNFVVASGENYPDAVVGGAYAANVDGALLLAKNNHLPRVNANYLEGIRLDVDNVFVFGGPNAIAPSVSEAIWNLNWRY